MPTMRRVAALCAALLVLAGCSDPRGRHEDHSSRTSRPDGNAAAPGWSYDYTGQTTNASFTDIAAASADDAWAVGKSPVTGWGDGKQTLLFHYSGKVWRPYDLPSELRRRLDELPTVRLDSSGPGDVWLFAGVLTNPDRSRPPLAAHWDGTAWRTVRLPRDFPQIVRGAAVFGPDDAWIVDGSRTAWHWDGHQWRASRLPGRAQALAGVSGRDLWAVGSELTPEANPSLAGAHWDGSQWTETTMPDLAPGPKGDQHYGELTRAIAVSAEDVRAFGTVSSEGGDTDAYFAPLAVRWDGSRWKEEDRPPCCVTGGIADGLLLTPKRYLTASGEARRIAQPHCLTSRSGGRGCGQHLELEDYATVPGTRQVWGVGSLRGGTPPPRPVIVRLSTAR
ncbi:hypothetical protein ACIPJS_14720 [Streptomyces sp. NPDC086783]|uniref:hypothetical protein n=1 Tax=Streptomyces sp. NPDC086783 TaxID=3365758 RepID=UPI0037FC7B73